MKKLLLFILVLGISMSTFAQFQLLSSKNYPKWGYLGANPLPNGDNQFIANFNSTQSTVAYNSYASSSKGMFGMFYSNETPLQNSGKAVTINGKKVESWGSTSVNPWRLHNLQAVLDSATIETAPAYSTSQQFWKPAVCILDVDSAATDQAWVMFPGMYKRVNFGFQIDLTGGFLTSDISCNLFTYNVGNTAKTTSYKMIVSIGKDLIFGGSYIKNSTQLDTISSTNVGAFRTLFGTNDIYVVDNIYTTSTTAGNLNRDTINIASAIGVDKSYLNGKKVYVQFYTMGTNTPIAPGTMDPMIAIDNIQGTYTPPSWVVPAGAVSNAVIDYNNGSPVVDPASPATDYSAGTPVSVAAATATPILINLTSVYRSSTLTITEANDGGAPNPKYTFAATGAVKAKDASGHFTIDVPYTFTPSSGTTKFLLTIAAPAAGTFGMDTLQIALTATVPLGITSTERLEINNGCRFWYDVAAIGSALTGAPSVSANAVKIWGKSQSIITANATEDVRITDLGGRVLKIASPASANKGIAIPTGVYIVETGKTIQKVIVQ